MTFNEAQHSICRHDFTLSSCLNVRLLYMARPRSYASNQDQAIFLLQRRNREFK